MGAKLKTPEDKKKQDTEDSLDDIEQDVKDGDTDPLKRQISHQRKVKRQELLKTLKSEADNFTPRTGPDTGGKFQAANPADFAEPNEEPPTPMTTEGEALHVELARLALHVKLDNVSITDQERDMLSQDVNPTTAKDVARVIRKIVTEYGLNPESYDSRIDSLIEDLKKNASVVALVPGSFKPPHKGHYAMIDHFANIADQTIVVISDPANPKSIRRTPGRNLQITARQALEVLRIYTKGRNITFITTSQPVKWVYDYVAEDTQPGQRVLLGVSGKGDDASRYVNAQKYAPTGVDVEASVFTDSDLNISASDFREVIDNLINIEDPQEAIAMIAPYLPDHLNDSDKYQVFDILSNLTEDLS